MSRNHMVSYHTDDNWALNNSVMLQTDRASLANVKSSLIERTFIPIAKFNREMGDWLIRKFLESKNFEKHAPLTANLIMCDRAEAPNRL